ncbi:MAG: hypothetical protein NC181_02015 [Clostridium sp.]|nr:hypothetical protein [Clostridium sp.]MCM1444082.1 hypothetical protein [Candidatus Amulumruptor caecigallinarius]
MEFIFEFVVELILDGTIQISKNQKVPKLIRYPLMIFILLLFLGVTLLIFFTGILSYQKINKICGIIFIVLGIVFFIASIIKFKNIYIKKKSTR